MIETFNLTKIYGNLKAVSDVSIKVKKEGASSCLIQKGYKPEYSIDGLIMISDPQSCERPEEVNEILVSSGFPPFYVNVEQEDLESYFLRIIGEKSA